MKQIINLGPAGSPSASTLDGITKVKELGLQTMEVQFSHGIAMGIPLAKKVGEEAKRQNITLSVHAPYYINLASDDMEKRKASKKRILDSCERGHFFAGKQPTKIVFHPAYFGKHSREEVADIVTDQIKEMNETIKEKKWNAVLAPETSGKHSAYGSLNETIELVKKTHCSLCVDLAHLYARNNGTIDYEEVLEKIFKLKLDGYHFHFSNIKYSEKGELNHLVLNGSPPFEPFAKELLKRKINATIISESPITWKDSLKMKEIFEKNGYDFS